VFAKPVLARCHSILQPLSHSTDVPIDAAGASAVWSSALVDAQAARAILIAVTPIIANDDFMDSRVKGM
jgi:hypothetical protein